MPVDNRLYSYLFCSIIMLILSFAQSKKKYSTQQRKFFIILIHADVLLFSGFLCHLFLRFENPILFTLGKAFVLVYFYTAVAICYMWLFYFNASLGIAYKYKKLVKVCSCIAMLFFIIVVLLSAKTNLSYYFDETAKKAVLYLSALLVAIIFVFFMISHLKVFIHYRFIFCDQEKRLYRLFSMYSVFPILFGFFQYLVPEIPFFCYGITILIVSIFISLQEMEITRDSLTQLNNRFCMENYLDSKMKEYGQSNEKRSKNLYLILIDVDKFKQINDTYGHVEGDRALCLVAKALSVLGRVQSFFLARYGGDEFVILYEAQTVEIAKALCEEISKTIINIKTEKEYSLKASVGLAVYKDRTMSKKDFLNSADSELYKDKGVSK